MGAPFLEVKVKGAEEFRSALKKLDPRKNPKAIRRGLASAGRFMERSVQRQVSGPRPRKLDQVTGELAKSPTTDVSRTGLEMRTGIPAKIFWAEFHELGLGRFQKRGIILPALEESLKQLPEIFVREWERALR